MCLVGVVNDFIVYILVIVTYMQMHIIVFIYMISLPFQVWFADTIVRSRHTMTYVPVDDVSRQQDHRT